MNNLKKFDVKNSLISDELKENLPNWWQSINKEDYFLVMTDDLDSLFSCQRLKTLFGLEVGGFYSFEKGLYINDKISENGWKTPIFVDLSIGKNQYCFDNHRTFVKNENKVNPNVIHRDYSNKYNFSTLTLIAALYGGVDEMSDIQKELLIAVDGGFIGYYKNGGRWKDVNIYWLKQLGLADYLIPILEEKSMKYFQELGVDYCLHDKIIINDDGYLEMENGDVPDIKFEFKQGIEKCKMRKSDAELYHRTHSDILVSAETYKDNYILNLLV